MKKILITGGAGFIGSHVVVELQNEGFEVLIILTSLILLIVQKQYFSYFFKLASCSVPQQNLAIKTRLSFTDALVRRVLSAGALTRLTGSNPMRNWPNWQSIWHRQTGLRPITPCSNPALSA